jgi:UDPglucose 6-dehydrogenase
MKSKIGIVGYGVIGKTTHQVLFPHELVNIYDIKLNSNIENLYQCNLVFICIPTDTSEDFIKIKDLISLLLLNNPNIEIVIRSTVVPGFFKNLQKNLTYFPEFLRERSAVEDALSANIMYYATSTESSLLESYTRFNQKLKRVSFQELEILKLMSNNYRAMKVVFANHFYDLCKRYNADYDLLLESFYNTKNNQSYMEVNDDLRGYGGKCLPKDLNFAIDIFSDSTLFKAIKNDNKKWKTTVRKN